MAGLGSSRSSEGYGINISNVNAAREGRFIDDLKVVAGNADFSTYPVVSALIHSSWVGAGKEIAITLYHDDSDLASWTKYVFGSAFLQCGDLALPMRPADAATAIAAGANDLPDGCSVEVGTNPWNPAQGIDRIDVESNAIFSWNSTNLGREDHVSYQGLTAGIPHTPCVVLYHDDGRIALETITGDGDYGTGLNTLDYAAAVAATVPEFKFHLGATADNLYDAANKVDPADMLAAVAAGGVLVNMHSSARLDAFQTVDIDYSVSDSKFIAIPQNIFASAGNSGTLAMILEEDTVAKTQRLMVWTPTKSQSFGADGASLFGSDGLAAQLGESVDSSVEDYEALFDLWKSNMDTAGFDPVLTRHFVYAQGAYRETVAQHRTTIQGMLAAGMQSSRVTTGWSTGTTNQLEDENGEVGTGVMAIRSMALEDLADPVPITDPTDYQNKILPWSKSVGGIHAAQFHSPVTGTSGGTDINVTVLFTHFDSLADSLLDGSIKMPDLDTLLSMIALEQPVTRTDGSDYDPPT